MGSKESRPAQPVRDASTERKTVRKVKRGVNLASLLPSRKVNAGLLNAQHQRSAFESGFKSLNATLRQCPLCFRKAFFD